MIRSHVSSEKLAIDEKDGKLEQKSTALLTQSVLQPTSVVEGMRGSSFRNALRYQVAECHGVRWDKLEVDMAYTPVKFEAKYFFIYKNSNLK